MAIAIQRKFGAIALCLGVAACAAPPGYWGTETTLPASAYVDWNQYAAVSDTPRVDYPGVPVYGATKDGGRGE